MGHGVAATTMEIEIEARRTARTPGPGRDAQLDAFAGHGRPGGGPLEVVDGSHLSCERHREGEEQQRKRPHPFTLPAMTPWM